MSKLALIDGDALCYQSSKETLAESIQNIDEKINNIFEKTEATHYVIFISNSPYFRHKISSDYKSGRSKYTSPLKWLKTLKNYLKEGWGAQSMNLVEADDLIAYWMNNSILYYNLNPRVVRKETNYDIRLIKVDGESDYSYTLDTTEIQTETNWNNFEVILASPDKDLLQSVVGKNFNYTYKLEDKTKPESLIKGWWVETSVEDASFFIWEQMICGDNADSVVGPYGKGKAWCDKNFAGKSLKEVRYLVFDEYMKEYGTEQGIHNFQKNFKLLHLLSSDEDFYRELGELPTFPEIRQVPTKSVEKVNLEDLKF